MAYVKVDRRLCRLVPTSRDGAASVQPREGKLGASEWTAVDAPGVPDINKCLTIRFVKEVNGKNLHAIICAYNGKFVQAEAPNCSVVPVDAVSDKCLWAIWEDKAHNYVIESHLTSTAQCFTAEGVYVNLRPWTRGSEADQTFKPVDIKISAA